MDKDVRRPSFLKVSRCSLQPPVIEIAELSPSASMTTNDKVTSLLSLLPPVPQNLSPSLAVSASARLPRQFPPHRPGFFSRSRVSFLDGAALRFEISNLRFQISDDATHAASSCSASRHAIV